jgi:hypothetical protein
MPIMFFRISLRQKDKRTSFLARVWVRGLIYLNNVVENLVFMSFRICKWHNGGKLLLYRVHCTV